MKKQKKKMKFLTKLSLVFHPVTDIPCKPETLIDDMNFTDRQEAFMTAIYELEDEGKIVSMKREKIVLTENSPYLRGTYRANAKGFGFITPEDTFSSRFCGDLYVDSENTCGAINGDAVLAAEIKSKHSGAQKSSEGIVLHIIKHEVTGTVRYR